MFEWTNRRGNTSIYNTWYLHLFVLFSSANFNLNLFKQSAWSDIHTLSLTSAEYKYAGRKNVFHFYPLSAVRMSYEGFFIYIYIYTYNKITNNRKLYCCIQCDVFCIAWTEILSEFQFGFFNFESLQYRILYFTIFSKLYSSYTTNTYGHFNFIYSKPSCF